MRSRLKVGIIIGVLLSAIVVGVTVAQSFTHVLNLSKGQTAYVTCDGAQRLRVDRQGELIALLSCGRAEQAQPTATPTVPPTEPTATATPVQPPPPGDMTDMAWHAPAAHGARPFQEPGDAVPHWVIVAGNAPSVAPHWGQPVEQPLIRKNNEV